MSPITLRRAQKCLISFFVVIHMSAITASAWPDGGSTLRHRLLEVCDPYLNGLALAQKWNMFAPQPPTDNFDIVATITYRDGSSTTWTFPRMQDLSYSERCHRERYRKWREFVRTDAWSALWPDAARWIARKGFREAANPPVTVVLTRWWSPIPPPHDGAIEPGLQPCDRDHSYAFFTLNVVAEDLK